MSALEKKSSEICSITLNYCSQSIPFHSITILKVLNEMEYKMNIFSLNLKKKIVNQTLNKKLIETSKIEINSRIIKESRSNFYSID